MLFKGIDLFDWYSGKMSSRRLLVLIHALTDTSAYQLARRNGDWTDDQYKQAALINELKLLRVDQAAINGSKMDAVLMESPAQAEANAEVQAEHDAQRAGILAQLHGQDIGTRPE